jgi:hypothetical protein
MRMCSTHHFLGEPNAREAEAVSINGQQTEPIIMA